MFHFYFDKIKLKASKATKIVEWKAKESMIGSE